MIIPKLERRHVLWSIGYGGLLMFWLSTENASPWVASLLGAGAAAGLVWLAVLRWMAGKKINLMGFLLLGALIGCGAVWTTQFLMLFKNAWHAHAFLDFPTSIILGMSRRLIPWTVAGGLLGLALGLAKS